MKIAAVSLNVIVGDVDNNLALIKQAYQEACGVNDPATGGTPQDLLLLPECVTCGYPPQDLLLRPSFMMKIMADLADLTQFTKGHHTKILLGSPYLIDNKIYNAAIFIDNGVLSVVGTKKYLPDYGEFDDSRIFHQGQGGSILPIGDKNFGILICEDMWHKDTVHDLIISEQDDRTIDGFISLNASPYEAHKFQKRHAWAHAHCKDHQRPFLNIYLMGGQDGLVFDGGNFALDGEGDLSFYHAPFCDQIHYLEFKKEPDQGKEGFYDAQNPLTQKQAVDLVDFDGDDSKTPPTKRYKMDYMAMVIGLRDYIRKTGFKKIVLGLSGGIDSALSAVVAVDAIGADNVTVLLLPSEYTSKESFVDAYDVIEALGIKHHIVPIKEAVLDIHKALVPAIKQPDQLNKDVILSDITQQNIQSRLRAVYLMAYSNQTGSMVLTTGNKSEMAVGYATLYGDMCGGYNVLKDVYKMDVYGLSEYRNKHLPINVRGTKGIKVPKNILTKAPTAELKPDQKDSDNLPDYPILDEILKGLIESEQSIEALISQGFLKRDVEKIYHLLKISEYKRQQSPPGPQLTLKSFDKQRRYPIVNGA